MTPPAADNPHPEAATAASCSGVHVFIRSGHAVIVGPRAGAEVGHRLEGYSRFAQRRAERTSHRENCSSGSSCRQPT